LPNDMPPYYGRPLHNARKKIELHPGLLAALYRQPEAFADVMQWPHDEFRETFLGSIATELHCAAFTGAKRFWL